MKPRAMRCACGAIDVHTHVVPAEFPRYAGSTVDVPWPSMAPAQPCHRHVMVQGKVFRTVTDRAWDPARRIEDMDALAVGAQVLSPMPELLSYWMDAKDAQPLLRYINELIAQMVNQAPDRFIGLGAVPLQDVDSAIAELEHVVTHLGLRGVEIAGNINNTVIGHAQFEPFWDAVESLDCAVFIHPLRPVGMERLVGPPMLEHLLAFPSETGLALASLVTGGVLARHPRLRVAASHGGGTFAALLPRLQYGWEAREALRSTMPLAPLELAKRLYFDTLVYDNAVIAQMVTRFGDTQLLMGSDFPFPIQDRDPAGRIAALGLPDNSRDRLLRGNAARWLGVELVESGPQ